MLAIVLNHMLSEKTASFPKPFPARFNAAFPAEFPTTFTEFPAAFPTDDLHIFKISHKIPTGFPTKNAFLKPILNQFSHMTHQIEA